jgi:hypothetical protein
MSFLHRILHRRVTSDATVARLVQLACFAAAPALLVVALRGLERLAATPGKPGATTETSVREERE